ncbi:MAG: HAMP domain-containing histidine kinase [bacterium]|nr:HAMP domain-containing histidine kinase [bacterium]
MISTKEENPVESPVALLEEDRDADRWLEVFSIFVHDLESPFASVKYLLGQIESDKFDRERKDHQVLLRSSRIALERAESILYDIMAVAKAGTVGIPVSTSNLVPDAVIQEAVELASGSVTEYGLEVTYTNNSGNIPVKADPKLLKRMLDNLIYNAVRHTPQGGRISVYTEPGENCVFIHVKDTGPGLGDIDTEGLFEKYGQLELRRQGKHRGVGLGLYFCKLAATGMGGTVLADDHPKGGAVFSIRLMKAEE